MKAGSSSCMLTRLYSPLIQTLLTTREIFFFITSTVINDSNIHKTTRHNNLPSNNEMIFKFFDLIILFINSSLCIFKHFLKFS